MPESVFFKYTKTFTTYGVGELTFVGKHFVFEAMRRKTQIFTCSSMDQEEQVTRPGLEELSPEMDRKIIENRGVEERPKASPSLLR